MSRRVPDESDLLIYTDPDGDVSVGVIFRDETAWLSQRSLAELFGVSVGTISRHLRNAFELGELEPEATVADFEIVGLEGRAEG